VTFRSPIVDYVSTRRDVHGGGNYMLTVLAKVTVDFARFTDDFARFTDDFARFTDDFARFAFFATRNAVTILPAGAAGEAVADL
jgi:hypothetical protein